MSVALPSTKDIDFKAREGVIVTNTQNKTITMGNNITIDVKKLVQTVETHGDDLFIDSMTAYEKIPNTNNLYSSHFVIPDINTVKVMAEQYGITIKGLDIISSIKNKNDYEQNKVQLAEFIKNISLPNILNNAVEGDLSNVLSSVDKYAVKGTDKIEKSIIKNLVEYNDYNNFLLIGGKNKKMYKSKKKTKSITRKNNKRKKYKQKKSNKRRNRKTSRIYKKGGSGEIVNLIMNFVGSGNGIGFIFLAVAMLMGHIFPATNSKNEKVNAVTVFLFNIFKIVISIFTVFLPMIGAHILNALQYAALYRKFDYGFIGNWIGQYIYGAKDLVWQALVDPFIAFNNIHNPVVMMISFTLFIAGIGGTWMLMNRKLKQIPTIMHEMKDDSIFTRNMNLRLGADAENALEQTRNVAMKTAELHLPTVKERLGTKVKQGFEFDDMLEQTSLNNVMQIRQNFIKIGSTSIVALLATYTGGASGGISVIVTALTKNMELSSQEKEEIQNILNNPKNTEYELPQPPAPNASQEEQEAYNRNLLIELLRQNGNNELANKIEKSTSVVNRKKEQDIKDMQVSLIKLRSELKALQKRESKKLTKEEKDNLEEQIRMTQKDIEITSALIQLENQGKSYNGLAEKTKNGFESVPIDNTDVLKHIMKNNENNLSDVIALAKLMTMKNNENNLGRDDGSISDPTTRKSTPSTSSRVKGLFRNRKKKEKQPLPPPTTTNRYDTSSSEDSD